MVHLKVHLLVQDATEDLSESKPKGVLWDLCKDAQEGGFEVKIKGALEVTIKLHLQMSMVVHLLGKRSAQNDSTNRWAWGGTLCCTWEHT